MAVAEYDQKYTDTLCGVDIFYSRPGLLLGSVLSLNGLIHVILFPDDKFRHFHAINGPCRNKNIKNPERIVILFFKESDRLQIWQ